MHPRILLAHADRSAILEAFGRRDIVQHEGQLYIIDRMEHENGSGYSYNLRLQVVSQHKDCVSQPRYCKGYLLITDSNNTVSICLTTDEPDGLVVTGPAFNESNLDLAK